MATSVRSDTTPALRSSDKTAPPKAMTIGTKNTSQISPEEMHVRFYPLRDGIHDEGFELEATLTDRSHDPNDQDHGL